MLHSSGKILGSEQRYYHGFPKIASNQYTAIRD